MENYQTQQDLNNPMGDGNFMPSNLPNATAVLILGIISIIGCCCGGIVGVICGAIGLILANKDMKLYQANPNAYKNFSNLNTGRILCIVGLIISVIYMLYSVYTIIFVYGGWDGYMDSIQEIVNQAQNQ